MSRNLAGLEGTWRIVSLALLVVVVAEAYYLSRLSDQLNDYRVQISESLETHLSDQYVIAKLKLEQTAASSMITSGAANNCPDPDGSDSFRKQ